MPKILVVDDERAIRTTLKEILTFENYDVDVAEDGKEAFQILSRGKHDLVICDVKMPNMTGLELLNKSTELKNEVQFIMISGHSNVEDAVEATKLGAYDYIGKPPDLNRLLLTVRNALDKTTLVKEKTALKSRIPKIPEIIGESEPIKIIKETISKVALTDAKVLITGANGSGKELVAKWIHEYSERNSGPLIEVNCAAIPSELIESELFGHEKGAFTGAVKQQQGKFELADGGTLFLDEIGDMSLNAQAKVLRVLQDNKITRIGSRSSIEVNVRVVAATNKNLLKLIETGEFREDLYHRLSVVVINVPPLKDRISDLPLIVEKFLHDLSIAYHQPQKTINKAAITRLQELEWTGNIRELHNVIERLVIFCTNEITEEDVLQFATPYSRQKSTNLAELIKQFPNHKDFISQVEMEYLSHKLIANKWNLTKTAIEIDLSFDLLDEKIKKYGLTKN